MFVFFMQYGYTPLMIACGRGYLPIAKYLIEMWYAKVNLRDNVQILGDLSSFVTLTLISFSYYSMTPQPLCWHVKWAVFPWFNT